MNPPLFVPIQKKNFDTIEMNSMTDTGEPVPFMDGVKAEWLQSLSSVKTDSRCIKR